MQGRAGTPSEPDVRLSPHPARGCPRPARPMQADRGGVVDAEPGLARASPESIRFAASTWSSPAWAGPI